MLPRGSIHTTIRELGPKIPYYIRNYGSQFPSGCICGPSGLSRDTRCVALRPVMITSRFEDVEAATRYFRRPNAYPRVAGSGFRM